MSTTIDQQFIEFIVKSLVGKPEAVKIERRIDEKGVLLELTVDAEDLGRVIGKRGATAQSLRTLLRALGTKNDARYNLKIVDVNGGPHQSSEPREDNRDSKETTEPEDVQDEPAAEVESTPPEEPAEVDLDDDEEVEEDKDGDSSDVISKTRKELEDLDDLDL